MTNGQKIIKYLAMAFAIFIIVSIISGIGSALGLFYVFDGDALLDQPKSYTVSDDLKGIKLEIGAAELKIKTADAFRLESNLKNLTVEESNNRLIVKEKGKGRYHTTGTGVVTLTVPKDYTFYNAEIITGAGIVVIEELKAKDLSIELGAGKANISNLTAESKSEIDGGTGTLTLKNCVLHNLDLDMGVGEVNFSGKITGNSDLDCGIGSVKAKIEGKIEDYTVSVSKGIGEITVGGEKMSDDETLGNGKNRLELSGGIGNIRFDFE